MLLFFPYNICLSLSLFSKFNWHMWLNSHYSTSATGLCRLQWWCFRHFCHDALRCCLRKPVFLSEDMQRGLLSTDSSVISRGERSFNWLTFFYVPGLIVCVTVSWRCQLLQHWFVLLNLCVMSSCKSNRVRWGRAYMFLWLFCNTHKLLHPPGVLHDEPWWF